jgi:hypothetical protein
MQTRWIYTENRTSSLYGIARENGRKKEHCKKTDKDRTRTRIVQIAGRLIKLHPALYLAPHPSGGQPTPSPPHPLTPYPRHASTLLAPRPTLPGPQQSTHTRSLLGPRAVRGPFSVQQPCESHVVRIPAVIPGPPCLSIRCRSTRRLTPRSVAGPTPPL